MSTRDVFIVVLGAAVLFSLASQGDTGSPKAQGAARAAPLDNPDGVRPGPGSARIGG